MDKYNADLPDELQGRTTPEFDEAPKENAIDRQDRLNAISQVFAKLRDESVKARRESGVEELMAACEDAYLGIDDQNRPAERSQWAKPTSMVGPLTKHIPRNGNKSTAFVRLTARYVDMGAAKVSEITLPIDGKAFSFGPTPVPELAAALEDQTPVQGPNGPVTQQMPDGSAKPLTVGDLAKKRMEKATEAAEKAETRIYDWMVESRYPMQMRKVMHDAARLGVGVLKAPFPELRKAQSFSVKDGVAVLESIQKVTPAYKWVSPWNLFPHKGCGEDIHTGDFLFERDYIAEQTLRELKHEIDAENGKPLYISSQIDKVIEEGPNKARMDSRNPADKNNNSQYELWNFYGTLTRADFLAFEPALGDEDLPEELNEIYCIISVINDTVIRATINPLDSGKFPFHTFPWSRRSGSWVGVGVAEQVSLPQTIVNAATRRLLDNAGISSGAQIVVKQNAIVPADGNWQITPDKLWFMTEDSTVDDIRKIFMSVTFPNLGNQLAEIIQYGFKLAEEATNIPLISQGQQGPQDPKTFGQAELQNNNANTLLRQIAYNLDDSITEPVVKASYEWLLMDPDVPADEKGDFEINARGSIAMVEKSIQEQTLTMLGQMSLNPAFGISPEKWAEEFVRVKRMDPTKIQYSEEEKQKMREQPPPEAPQVTIAKMREAGAMQRAQIAANVTMQKAQMDTDRDTIYTQSMMRRDQTNAEMRRAELSIKREIAYLTLQINKGINVDNNKTSLASTVMKLQTQKQLSYAAMQNGKAQQVATPPTEPAGKAAPGHAYEA